MINFLINNINYNFLHFIRYIKIYFYIIIFDILKINNEFILKFINILHYFINNMTTL